MKLYKFRAVNTNSLTLLANNQLWFSSLDDFNDPFEGAHILNNHLQSVKSPRGAVDTQCQCIYQWVACPARGIEASAITDACGPEQ